jgi:hypothetical protein
MADDLTTGLYRLIEADLKNESRYPEMKAFHQRVILSPIVVPAFAKAPYVVVTPGVETGEQARGEDRNLDVLCWVITSIFRDGYGAADLTGKGVDADGGTLVRAVRRTLARIEPFWDDAVFGTSPYPAVSAADRTSISSCQWIQTGSYEQVRDPKFDPENEVVMSDLHLARPVTMRYEMVEVA